MKTTQPPPGAGSRTPPADAGKPGPRSFDLRPGRALLLPGAFTLALVMFALWDPVREHPQLFRSFLGAAGVLLVWSAGLGAAASRAGRTLRLEVALYRHHWVQALAQVAVLLYLGWHVRYVYGFLPLIAAQLIFAYGVDSLLTWSRRNSYRLGFGPFPVIGSINLFLWFKPEWFHWQFAMVAVGYAAKEFIRWNRGGRRAHIFNPSSFPLALFSLVLILTASTDLTLGQELANGYAVAPHIYLLIFLAAVPGQVLFGVARMTMPAVLTLWLISQAYFWGTGTYLFFDTHIPAPVFLGMHLLLTDPSTSPRTDSGRILFGVIYAFAITAFYFLLTAIGAPTFYDKLLPLPLMNLMVRRIDRLMESAPLARLDPARLMVGLSSLQRNVVYTSAWVVAFMALSAVQGVGDRHPGQFLPMWEQACAEGSSRACTYAMFRKANYCTRGSGWGCNEWGIQLATRGQQPDQAFRRGCELGFEPACRNAGRPVDDPASLARAEPTLRDLPIVLSGKRRIDDMEPAELYALGCRQGWPGMCRQAGAAPAPEAGPRP